MDMNNEKISDAERNEELFEYEMTEVMMKLNGQLAEYHGSGLQVDLDKFESKKIGAEIKISEVEVENKAEKIKDIPKAECNAKIAEIEITPSTVTLQASPVQKTLKVTKVEIKRIEQENLNININTGISIKKVIVDMPEITEIKNTVSVKKITRVEVADSKQAINIKTRNISNTICDLKIDIKKHEYPKTTIGNISKIISDVYMEKTSDVKIPSILSFDDSYVKTDFSRENLKNNVIKLEKIDTKNIRIECDNNIDVSKINCEYPTVDAINLASAKIQNTKKSFKVEVPDFSKEIRAIVESAV